MRQNFKYTIYASYIGYIVQAIVNNFAPLLFLTFQKQYDISITRIGLLISINFGIQLLVDFVAVHFVDRIGYRVSVVAAHVFSAAGLIGMGFLPELFADPYVGLVLAIFFYAIGGGLIEVLISPIVEACPTEDKSGNMSLLHSFYCWGHVFVVLLSTLFFWAVGIEHWKILTVLWALVPLFNVFLFMQVPIRTLVEEGQAIPMRKLFTMKLFWLFVLMMVCSGASEQAMSQWASAFAEMGLQVDNQLKAGLLAAIIFSICLFAAVTMLRSKKTEA